MQNKKSLELTPVSFMVKRRVACHPSPDSAVKNLFGIVEEVEREIQKRRHCHSRELEARLQSIKNQLYQRWQSPGTVPHSNDEFERLLLQIGADFEINKYLTRGIEANLNKLYRHYQETRNDREREDAWSVDMAHSTPLFTSNMIDMSHSRREQLSLQTSVSTSSIERGRVDRSMSSVKRGHMNRSMSLVERGHMDRSMSSVERGRVDCSVPNHLEPSQSLPMNSISLVEPVFTPRPRKRTAQQADVEQIAKMAKFWRLNSCSNQRINNIIQALPKGEPEQNDEAMREAIGWLLY